MLGLRIWPIVLAVGSWLAVLRGLWFAPTSPDPVVDLEGGGGFAAAFDVFLPAGTGSQILLGQRAIAGETILGEIGVDPQRSGSSQ